VVQDVVLRVDRAFQGLSVRWHSCAQCGTGLPRDHNAAPNIARLGRQQRAVGQTVQTSAWPAGASVA
jgi:transposase